MTKKTEVKNFMQEYLQGSKLYLFPEDVYYFRHCTKGGYTILDPPLLKNVFQTC
jgi:hypothetical protein